MIGTHVVNVYTDPAAPTGTPVDVTHWVDSVSIQHGRANVTDQPEASAATLEVSLGTDPWPTVVEIGAWIKVATEAGGATYTRFLGRVTDIAQSWDEAEEETPDRAVGTIVAVGILADFSRRIVGDEAWPQELDGARVARVFAAAGYTLAASDAGRVEVIPRDAERGPSLDIATATANSAGGLIYATREGGIGYADAEHRRYTGASLDLEASDVLAAPTWMRNLEGLVNEVTMTYGVPPIDEEGNEGERPTYYAVREDSQARYGRYEYATDVQLAAAADVAAAVDLLLLQNASPVWLLQELPLDVAGLTVAQTQAMLGLEVNNLVRVGGMPSAGRVPTSVAAWVEGWSETLTYGGHEMTLMVSDYCRTAPPPRWDDLPTTMTWDNVGAAHTWDSAVCLGPPANLGTWDTVPATLRWDQVDPSMTWDTWAA